MLARKIVFTNAPKIRRPPSNSHRGRNHSNPYNFVAIFGAVPFSIAVRWGSRNLSAPLRDCRPAADI